MSDGEGIAEADDTLDDDCTCEEGCFHEEVADREGNVSRCDAACPVHGGR
jgi:hypothetical protein